MIDLNGGEFIAKKEIKIDDNQIKKDFELLKIASLINCFSKINYINFEISKFLQENNLQTTNNNVTESDLFNALDVFIKKQENIDKIYAYLDLFDKNYKTYKILNILKKNTNLSNLSNLSLTKQDIDENIFFYKKFYGFLIVILLDYLNEKAKLIDEQKVLLSSIIAILLDSHIDNKNKIINKNKQILKKGIKYLKKYNKHFKDEGISQIIKEFEELIK